MAQSRRGGSAADDAGKLMLRVTLALLMLFHGYAKIRNGVSGIEGMLTGAGLPAWLAYGVYIGEVLAPLLLLLGWYARVGGVIIAINMVFAVALAHSKQFLDLTKTGGWALELQAFFLICGLVVALIGPGRYAVNNR
ncbi:MAG: DoxX family protein [Betaproteobacteria bacterium]|nr:DoxX family protein [Betaproteobacteria bacterium]